MRLLVYWKNPWYLLISSICQNCFWMRQYTLVLCLIIVHELDILVKISMFIVSIINIVFIVYETEEQVFKRNSLNNPWNSILIWEEPCKSWPTSSMLILIFLQSISSKTIFKLVLWSACILVFFLSLL